MEKSWYVRVIEGKEVKRDNPIEYFVFTEIRSSFRSKRERWQLKFLGMNRFLEEGRMEREKESILLSVGENRKEEHKH